MGPPKNLFRDFALAFWKTARDDMERAQDAMDFTEIEASIALSRAMSVFSEITSLLRKEYKLEIIE